MMIYEPRWAGPYAGPYTVAAPDSCALCCVVWREHGQRGHDRHAPAGSPAGYVAPDDALRLARMRARRAERLITAGVIR